MRLAAEAVRLGADLPSPEAATLREKLHRIAKRKQRMAVGGARYELRGSVYGSFGEDAFRVQLRRV